MGVFLWARYPCTQILAGEETGNAVRLSCWREAHGPKPVKVDFLENATVCGRGWYKILVAPVLTLDVTV